MPCIQYGWAGASTHNARDMRVDVGAQSYRHPPKSHRDLVDNAPCAVCDGGRLWVTRSRVRSEQDGIWVSAIRPEINIILDMSAGRSLCNRRAQTFPIPRIIGFPGLPCPGLTLADGAGSGRRTGVSVSRAAITVLWLRARWVWRCSTSSGRL